MQDIENIIRKYNAKPYGVKKQSSVLLPLIERNGQTHVLYEVRSETIPQPGETSFPGGRIERGETPEEAAIRETTEELQIKREQIEVYGEIDYIVSGDNMIHCFVGKLIDVEFEDIQPNEEVSRLFTLPLNYLRKNRPRLYKINLTHNDSSDNFPYHLIRNGRKYRFNNLEQHIPFYNLQEETLWGFTANLTDRFIQIIDTTEYKSQ